MHSKFIVRLSRLLTISVLPLLLIACWGNGSGPDSVPDAKAPSQPDLVDLLNNGDFESGDASSGDNLGTPPGWSGSFNGIAVSSCLFDECQQVPVPRSPDQVLKLFGPANPNDASGAFQNVEAIPGQTYTASAWANNSSVDPLQGNNLAGLQLIFLDDAGVEIRSKEITAGVDDLPLDAWVKLELWALAPQDAAFAKIQLLHIQVNNPPTGGAIFWDDASLSGPPTGEPPPGDFELIWSDEFDDWCGEGICSPDPNNWTIETGYGPNDFGWGNNEWQLYTKDLDNVRVQSGNLVISACCGSCPVGYFQNFEGLDAEDPGALSDAGFVYFADVWGKAGSNDAEVGVDTFKYSYGPAGAPNGGPAFSAVARGEGGVNQGAQYMSVYSDYNNADQTVGGSCGANSCTINTSVFQESTIVLEDIGATYTFTFDAKSPSEGGIFDAVLDNGGNISKPTSASAYIKTLDPKAGFATTNDIRVDMTNISNEEWATFFISLDMTDPLLEGQLLQFGFNTVTTEYDTTGVFYDNISFTKDSGETAECVGEDAVRGDDITSGKINTLETFNTIRYGKIEARIKPAVGKAAWPAFWMLGSNFPEVDWPNSGEIDIMEMWNTRGSNPMTAHSTMHWCGDEDLQQAPRECPGGVVRDGGSFVFPESLGDDFHLYTAIWDPDRITFFVDDTQIFSRTIDLPTMAEFTRDFYMILNVAMGGTLGSDEAPPDGTEVWPQTMLVDWVRVYQAVQ